MTTVPRFLPDGTLAKIWQRKDRRRFEPGPRAHAELVVLIGLQGQARYYLDGRIHVIDPRDALFAYPGQAHFLLGETRGTDLLVAVLAAELLVDGHDHVLRDPGDQDRPAVVRLVRPGYDEILTTGLALANLGQGPLCEMGAAWWLHRLWTRALEADRYSANRLHPAVAYAVEALRDDPGQSIGDIARRAGITATRLGQLFQEQISQTPSAFRRDRRLDRFDRLSLLDGKASLMSLALDAGFPDYSSFYRAHVAVRGEAPRRSRKSSG